MRRPTTSCCRSFLIVSTSDNSGTKPLLQSGFCAAVSVPGHVLVAAPPAEEENEDSAQPEAPDVRPPTGSARHLAGLGYDGQPVEELGDEPHRQDDHGGNVDRQEEENGHQD